MGRTFGRYEIVRPIARGGMAEVFLARRRGPGGVEKRLVVKRIRRERTSDPRFAAMFVNEARLSMSFAHRNIVSVFDFGRAGDELFLVMEYVDGVSLGAAMARAVERQRAIDPVVVAFVGLEACQALEHAHGIGSEAHVVVHRDVTPSNVLLSFGGEVKLVDFGVAALAAEQGDGRVRGTPGYLAPEQARGEAIDRRSDLWSLGICLWEALAGRRAFAATSVASLLEANLRGELPALPDGVPAPLRAIVERATRAAPGERFADARAMQLALDDYLVDARAGDASERRTPPSHRLAALLAELFEDREPTAGGVDAAGVAAGADGPVHTFLDDGEEAVAGVTARSLAATVGATEDRAALDLAVAPTALGVESSAAPPARSARRGWTPAVGVGGLVALAVAWLARAGAGDAPVAPPAPAAEAAVVAPRTDGRPTEAAPAPTASEPSPTAAAASAAASEPADPRPQRPSRTRDRASKVASAPAPAAPAPTGRLEINASPWARIRVEGRAEGCAETPCVLALPAGRYTLQFDNAIAGVGASREVVVEPGKTARIVETLTRPR